MLPSRGLTRAHGLVSQSQILTRAPFRSITRQPRLSTAINPKSSTARQFGTSLRTNGRPSPLSATGGLLLGGRISAAGVLSSQALLLSSARRFASTDSTIPTSPDASTTSSDFVSPEFSAFPDIDSSSLFNIPEKVGYLSELGLDYGFGPTSILKYGLEHLHFTAGLPWWAAIIGLGVVVRAALAYPALIAQQESVKSRELRENPLFRETQERFMRAMISGTAQQSELLELRMQTKLLQEQAGVKSWKMFAPILIQFPLIVGAVRLMRTMAALPIPGLDTAGVLWFTDLTVPDPFFILPCVGAGVMLLSVKRSLPFLNDQQAQMMKWLPWILGPIGIAVTANMAATVQLYLAVAAIGQYLQTSLWQMSIIRRLCGLPPLEVVKHGAQQPRTSPFSSPGGIQYQAPRTINTTATEGGAKSTTDSGAPKSDVNPVTYFMKIAQSVKEAKGSVSSQVGKYRESSSAKHERKVAEDYEKRRLREENEKYQARREEQQYRMEQRKLNSKGKP